MTPRAKAAFELASVFAVILLVELIVIPVRTAARGVAPETVGSQLATAAAGTLAFWAFLAMGRRRLAWAIACLLLFALVGSVFAARVGNRLAPIPVVAGFPVALAPIPTDLVPIADWPTDRSLAWALREPAFTIRADAHIVIDGTPTADYSYLALSNPLHFDGGTKIIVEGVVSSGGVTVGLQKANRWMAYTTVDWPGSFRSFVDVPRDDDYQLVFAYGVRARVAAHVELSPLTLWK